MHKILLLISILVVLSSYVQDQSANDPEYVHQKWYLIDQDEKILISEFFYSDLLKGELIKWVNYEKHMFKSTREFKNGLISHFSACSNSHQLNNKYFFYDHFGNLIKEIDSSRTPAAITNYEIERDPSTNKVIQSTSFYNKETIVKTHSYDNQKHVTKTFAQDTMLHYRAEYFYETGQVKAKVYHYAMAVYDSTTFKYDGQLKTLEESYNSNGLNYSMEFKYENDTLKKIDKHYPDGRKDEIIVEYD